MQTNFVTSFFTTPSFTNAMATSDAPQIFRSLSQVATLLEPLLSPVLLLPASRPLTTCLTDLAYHIRRFASPIRRRLLDLVSLLVAGVPWVHAEPSVAQFTGGCSGQKNRSSGHQPSERQGSLNMTDVGSAHGALGADVASDVPLLCLAMQMLALYARSSPPITVLFFVLERVVPMLHDHDVVIRREAATTCCLVLQQCSSRTEPGTMQTDEINLLSELTSQALPTRPPRCQPLLEQ